MKDHEIRELVNQLRDIAIEYHGTQQLRERIARAVRAAMLAASPHDTPRSELGAERRYCAGYMDSGKRAAAGGGW